MLNRWMLLVFSFFVLSFTQIGGVSAAEPGLNGLSVSPGTVVGGAPAKATVTLSDAAPKGGYRVWLKTDQPDLVTVPEAAVVPAGKTSVTVALKTGRVDDTNSVIIYAGDEGRDLKAVLKLQPVSVKKISFKEKTVIGGQTLTGTLALDGTAQDDMKFEIVVKSDDAKVDSAAVIEKGKKSGTFTISTNNVEKATKVVVFVAGAEKLAESFSIVPLDIAKISVSESSVVGGEQLTGTVTLSGAAPEDMKLEIGLDGEAAKVDGAVVIASGKKAGTFTIDTSNVEKATKVVVTVYYRDTKLSTKFSVVPLTVAKIAISKRSALGGETLTGTVTLTGNAPEKMQVDVALEGESAKIDGYVVIAKGKKSGTFRIYTENVSKSTKIRVYTSESDGKVFADATLLPLEITKVTLDAKSVIGGGVLVGTVHLTGKTTEDMKVEISSDSEAVKLEGYALIPKGEKAGTFVVYTSNVEKRVRASVNATSGEVSASAKFTIEPLSITSFTGPKRAVSGDKVTLTIVLSGKVPADGVKFAVKTSDPELAPVADTIVIEKGARGQIRFVAGDVKEPVKVEITVIDGDATYTAVVLIVPAE